MTSAEAILEMYRRAWFREIRRAWPDGHQYHAGHYQIDCLVVWTRDAVAELLRRRAVADAYAWLGDGTDDLTTCPTSHVLITPEALQAILTQRDAAVARYAQARADALDRR